MFVMNMWVYSERKDEEWELRELLGLEPVSVVDSKGRLRWFEHVEREYFIG